MIRTDGSIRLDVYEFQKEEGPELVRHLQQSIELCDVEKAEGKDLAEKMAKKDRSA